MACNQTSLLTDEEYIREFTRKAIKQRIPLSGNLDLTYRCNLHCTHCYYRGQHTPKDSENQELSMDQWKSVIDEITAAGCLYLLLTGGEPLLREDFADIYRHAKTNGLLVTVFTNGTLINDRILELFTQFPPKAVEISLYGATAKTHESITGVKGSYTTCLNGIKRLKEMGVNVKLKTILMTINSHEFFDIESMAREFDVKFRFDAAVFPRLNGDKTPISLRVPVGEAVNKEFLDDGRAQEWKGLFNRMQGPPVKDKVYLCGAAITHFHVDPSGNLQPCLMVPNPKYSLRRGGFLTGWNEILPQIRHLKPQNGNRCFKCEKRILCGYCPGFFKLEKGSENLYSEYLCEMGKLRFEKISIM